MSMKLSTKWIVVVLALVLIIGGSVWWFNSTKVSRKQKSEYKQLVRFANRQEVEIAVIRQASILQKLKDSLRKSADPNSR